jgi:uncharacterized protein
MENTQKIAETLKQMPNIQFAYAFGSRVKGTPHFGSDLDIALYFDKEPDLLEIGMMVNELEEASGLQVDLVKLNGLHKKNPKLAHRVIDEGILLFSRDDKALVEFKKSAILWYLDFKPVIDLFERKLAERISNKKFGKVER